MPREQAPSFRNRIKCDSDKIVETAEDVRRSINHLRPDRRLDVVGKRPKVLAGPSLVIFAERLSPNTPQFDPERLLSCMLAADFIDRERRYMGLSYPFYDLSHPREVTRLVVPVNEAQRILRVCTEYMELPPYQLAMSLHSALLESDNALVHPTSLGLLPASKKILQML